MTTLPDTRAVTAELSPARWLTIWLDEPQTRNALSAALSRDLLRVLEAARDDRGVRGITLRGRGGTFCAGGDLKSFGARGAGGDRADIVAMSATGAALFEALDAQPQVVIAVVEGAALAGGFGLVCCADVVIAEAKAKFALTETMIGLSPAQISPFVLQRLGYSTGRRLMLTGARFGATEALALGLADFVADGVEALTAQEDQVQADVLRCAPGAIAATKALIRAAPRLAGAEMVQRAAETFADRLLSEEGLEGVASFLEKRPPHWARKP
jgi:isohexenylglutaconyl-CoA hydratase